MAKQILRDVYVSVNGVDLSDHVDTIAFSEKWPNIDVTGMGAKFVERLLGIGDASIQLNLFQDYAASEVFDTLRPLAGSNTPFPVVVRPVKADGVSATNPNFTMQAVLDQNDPLNGKVGAASMTSVTLWNADQAGVVVTET
jgi:hypothetical protein